MRIEEKKLRVEVTYDYDLFNLRLLMKKKSTTALSNKGHSVIKPIIILPTNEDPLENALATLLKKPGSSFSLPASLKY